MAIYACVAARLPWEDGTRAAVYVTTVIVIIVLLVTGHPLADAVTAAAGISWAACAPARKRCEAP